MTPRTRRTVSTPAHVKDSTPWISGAAAVLVGGTAGAGLRLVLPELPFDVASPSLLPNALACLLIGFLHGSRKRWAALLAPLGAIGFCGGLSTFSGLALTLAHRVSAGDVSQAVLTACLEVALGLCLALLGDTVATRLWRARV